MTDVSSSNSAPRWQLDSAFPGFDSDAYRAAKDRLKALARDYLAHLESAPEAAPDSASFRAWLTRALSLGDESDLLARTLSSYCYAVYSTDTGDKRAMSELNAVDEILLPFARCDVLFANVLAAHAAEVRAAIAEDSAIGQFGFYLEDTLFWQTRQMTAAEEDLAADLARSGADAWGRLQEQLTSSASCVWDESTGERKTITELRALAFSPDRATREKAFLKETETCAGIALPVAAALNGIKGASISLNKRRHWAAPAGLASPNGISATGSAAPASEDQRSPATGGPALSKSLRQGRLSEKALAALIQAMEESLSEWRRYLKAKARALGVPALAFSDLFAPVGGAMPTYAWSDVRDVVVRNFESFSPRMGAFARRAFDSGWIDAEPRPGKVGGAYCTDLPLVKETRVLANFDGAFNSVTTVAHELGHAFHFDVVKDLPSCQQDYPMTLAETASIFAETVVYHAELSRAADEARLGLIENHLQDGCQIIVDILSRFYFERSVFAERESAELTAEELCGLMVDAQKRTYGDGLDPERLHPYMWLVKCHYYSSELAFYNFPYAFGQLFALALYARYRKEGPAFATAYESILRETGRMDAVALTAQAGCDIESVDFWRAGIGTFIEEIDEFERLTANAPAQQGGTK